MAGYKQQQEEEGQPDPPRATYLVTLPVVLVVLLTILIALILQLCTAIFLWPLLLCARDRFFNIQNRIAVTCIGLGSVALNPFWCQNTYWIGPAAGPPDMVPGSILFCNHRSNSDPFLVAWLLVRLCIEARFIFKGSLTKLPVLGWMALLGGNLPVRFGNKEQIKAMLNRSKEVLQQGYHIMVFPEGTRSPSGVLQDFKPSFFDVCAELNCPAIPICILGSERAWPHGGFRMGCASVHIAIGEPVMPGRGGGKALSEEVASKMQEMAREVLEERADDADSDEADDPFVTGRPYSYWTAPKELEGLGEEEQMQLLRSGKAHERGAHLF